MFKFRVAVIDLQLLSPCFEQSSALKIIHNAALDAVATPSALRESDGAQPRRRLPFEAARGFCPKRFLSKPQRRRRRLNKSPSPTQSHSPSCSLILRRP